jgi:long-subunit acyl-CoA synthetase (AMP-forming)
MHYNYKTLGQFVSKISYQLVPIDADASANCGKLLIKGPNVALNLPYHQEDIVEIGGELWYDTKDIIEIDEDGYIKYISSSAKS